MPLIFNGLNGEIPSKNILTGCFKWEGVFYNIDLFIQTVFDQTKPCTIKSTLTDVHSKKVQDIAVWVITQMSDHRKEGLRFDTPPSVRL